MLKYIICFITASLFSLIASANLPPAQFNSESGAKISSAFIKHYQEGYEDDMQGVLQLPIPTYEQSYVYAKWMNKAFIKAGYSMDATIREYLRTERTPPVVFFMSLTSLENFIHFLHFERIGKAFVDAGAISKDTAIRITDNNVDAPIGERADYDFWPIPDYRTPIIPAEYDHHQHKRHTTRRIGYIRQGTSKLWDNYLYFEDIRYPGELNGIGMLTADAVDESEFEAWQALVDKKIKIEMSIFSLSGIEISSDDGKNKVTSPSPDFS